MTNPITREQLRADILSILEDEPDELRDDDNLIDMGLDSMRAMNLLVQWEEAGIQIDFMDLAGAPTIGELWALLSERQGAA